MTFGAATCAAVLAAAAVVGAGSVASDPAKLHQLVRDFAGRKLQALPGACYVIKQDDTGDSQTYGALEALDTSVLTCGMSFECDVIKPLMDFMSCLASNQPEAEAQTLWKPEVTSLITSLCSCRGTPSAPADGTELAQCMAASPAAHVTFAMEPCDSPDEDPQNMAVDAVATPYYSGTAGLDHLTALMGDLDSPDLPLALSQAVCANGCFDIIEQAVQNLIDILNDPTCGPLAEGLVGFGIASGVSMLPEELTSELQELPTAHELMEMAKQTLAEGYAQLRLVCMQGESPTGDSVSCLSTMASIVASAEAGGADAVVSALCPTTTDNALIDSGCCMRDIMAAVPRSELPEADFWVKVDQGCGLGLSTSDPDRALDFCANPFATSTAESFVVNFRVAGAESWCAAEQVTRVQQAATAVLGAKDSQVCMYVCLTCRATSQHYHRV
eukprot:TRINITY_DN2289_c0_g1_i2.p1 TRINITY_DN2289_c0_g1~~TRINITY_DN2289_c0_g1_i2.p1  ORF type:complete len:443 (-),score=109.63 TRINITY_DN2289_c0_g1_i2:1081-2409(-)